MITLSDDQKSAFDGVLTRLEVGEKLVTLGGYAGTGKTTTTAEIAKAIKKKTKKNIAFCCFTGKAAKVLESKLARLEVMSGEDTCGTIHSLVYDSRETVRKKTENGVEKEVLTYSHHSKLDKRIVGLVICDEASMVNEEIYTELASFKVPILAVGDHGQLPPVFGEFNLMDDPDFVLEKIHRQAENDPIIQVATLARTRGIIPVAEYGPECIKTNSEEIINQIKDPREWVIITGTNKKRTERNRWARWKLGFHGDLPNVGERVVCLKNSHSTGIMNGMVGTVTRLEQVEGTRRHWVWLEAQMDSGDKYVGEVWRYQFGYPKPMQETIAEALEVSPRDFGDLFDFGYAITCHKAQGSEWDKVIVYEEQAMRYVMMKTKGEEGWRRWLYTAITRAKKELIIVGE